MVQRDGAESERAGGAREQRRLGNRRFAAGDFDRGADFVGAEGDLLTAAARRR